jgi:hypothetical protein
MKFGKLLFVVLALGLVCCGAAQAQLSVYGVYQATRLSGMKCEDTKGVCSGPVSNAEGASGAVGVGANSHVNTTGGWGGITYDFKTVGPVRLGVDLRAGEGHSNKSGTAYSGGDNATTTQDVLVGLKGTFHTPIKMIKPYAQVSAGWARSNAAEQFATPNVNGTMVRQYDNFVQYKAFIGMDIKIFPILDLRLPELGLGNMNTVGTTGSGLTTNSLFTKSVALGIVFHLPAS